MSSGGSPRRRPGRAGAHVCRGLAVGLALAACSEPHRAQAPNPNSGATPVAAFVNVAVVPMDAERVLEGQTVVVRDGRIVAVGPAASAQVPAGATLIDAAGKYLIPGLADMHAHFVQGAGDITDGAGQQLALFLANGVTTARGLVAPPGYLAVRRRVVSGELVGPTLFVAAPSLNGKSVKSAEQAKQAVAGAKAAGYDVLKTHGGLGRGVYDSVVAAARRAGLPLVGHVTPDIPLAHALEVGQQVEHLDGYLLAAVREGAAVPPFYQIVVDPHVLAQVDEGKLPALARATREAGVWNGPTLALFETIVSDETPEALAGRPEMRYVPAGARSAWAAQKQQFLASNPPLAGRERFIQLRRELTKALASEGAKLLVGSDSPQAFMVPGFAVHREMAAFVAAGLTPYQALEAATRNPAEFMGRLADAGTVAVGRRADLVLLDANPLADIGNAGRIAGVMVGGRWMRREEIARMLEAVAVAVGG